MKIKVFLVGLFWSVFLIIFLLLSQSGRKFSECRIYKEVFAQTIKAKVERKFIDTLNHNNKTITYLNEKKEPNEIIFHSELRAIYNFLNVGDSIVKSQYSLYYYVKSNATGKFTRFSFHTSCKESIK